MLGRGNGGTVYKVRHRETCALYALKVQHSGGGGELADAEADILSRTASPFVVRCHAVLPASASASGDVALLLELVDGGSLDAVARRRVPGGGGGGGGGAGAVRAGVPPRPPRRAP